jgi:hypothetical protein
MQTQNYNNFHHTKNLQPVSLRTLNESYSQFKSNSIELGATILTIMTSQKNVKYVQTAAPFFLK